MTLENLLSQVGMGSKLTDRYSEYGASMPESHVYNPYEHHQPMVVHQPTPVAASPKYHHSSSGLKSNASMSALTLLAFLFFLHILQQCIKEHMTEMSQTPIVVMTGAREGELDLSKSDKIDRTGVVAENTENFEKPEIKSNPFQYDNENKMMRINSADHYPRKDYDHENIKKTSVPGFVSAPNEDRI